MAVSYQFAQARIQQRNGAMTPNAASVPRESRDAKAIEPLTDKSNPVYNFTSDFVSKFQDIPATDIAMAVPYIRLSALGANGELLEDYTLEFFQKPIDMAAVNGPGRFTDRPIMSIKSAHVSSDQSGGYLTITKVSLQIKIHRADDYVNGTLLSLMAPGTMMRLIYGWNSTNKTLDEKDVVLFNVIQYKVSLDTTGQIDLSLEGINQGASYGSVFVGDTGKGVTEEDFTTDAQAGNIASQGKRVETYTNHIKQNKQGRSTARNIDVIKSMASASANARQRAALAVRRNCLKLMAELARKKKSDGFKFVTEKRRKTTTLSHGEYVTFHDIIKTLCGSTLDALHGTFVPSDRKFRVVYGAFNETLENFAYRSLADFPVSWKDFSHLLNEMCASGQPVPTLNAIINSVIDMMGDEMYWRNNLITQNEKVMIPQIFMQCSSHFVGNEEIVQLTFTDMHTDVPNTITKLNEIGVSQATQKQIEDIILKNALPVISLGHANTFIKSINLSADDDEGAKAIRIARTQGWVSARMSVGSAEDTKNKQVPLFLPLKGDMEVLGHVQWKPFRFFYLRTGLYIADAIYSILSVSHDIDATGFKTKVSFIYH